MSRRLLVASAIALSCIVFGCARGVPGGAEDLAEASARGPQHGAKPPTISVPGSTPVNPGGRLPSPVDSTVVLAGVTNDGSVCVFDGTSGDTLSMLAGSATDVVATPTSRGLSVIDAPIEQDALIRRLVFSKGAWQETASLTGQGSDMRLISDAAFAVATARDVGMTLLATDGTHSAGKAWPSIDDAVLVESNTANLANVWTLSASTAPWTLRASKISPTLVLVGDQHELAPWGDEGCAPRLVMHDGQVDIATIEEGLVTVRSREGVLIAASTVALRERACVEDIAWQRRDGYLVVTSGSGNILRFGGEATEAHLALSSAPEHEPTLPHHVAIDPVAHLMWVAAEQRTLRIVLGESGMANDVGFSTACRVRSLARLNE